MNKIIGRFDFVAKTLARQHIFAYKSTRDNWYPSYQTLDMRENAGLVRVSLGRLSDGLFRVCVWGADDFGMEKDQASMKKAIVLFLNIMLLPYVDQRELREMGFENA